MTIASDFRDFDAEEPDEDDREVKFHIGGEDFHCIWPMPYGQALDITRAQLTGNTVLALEAQLEFFDRVLTPESRDRWEKAINDPTRRIDARRVVAVMDWLLEVYMERPTSEGSGSSPGPSQIGNGSTAGSDSLASAGGVSASPGS